MYIARNFNESNVDELKQAKVKEAEVKFEVSRESCFLNLKVSSRSVTDLLRFARLTSDFQHCRALGHL